MTAPLLEVRGLTKRYLGVAAVDDVSFAIDAGGIVGLIGPNGSGKSTTIDCLSGFQRADAGHWALDGKPLAGRPAHAVARAGLTRSFQTVRAYDELSLIENLRVAAQQSDGADWWQALLRTEPLRTHEAASRARALELLTTVGLERYADAPAAVLSYGQRKLLALAACMMSRPRLAIFDEPVAGVNPTMIRRIESVVRAFNASGTTLVIVEHNVDFILNLCDRVIVLESGRTIADGAPALIRSDPRVLAAYLGRSGAAAMLARGQA